MAGKSLTQIALEEELTWLGGKIEALEADLEEKMAERAVLQRVQTSAKGRKASGDGAPFPPEEEAPGASTDS